MISMSFSRSLIGLSAVWLFYICQTASLTSNLNTLRSAQILFRHGARTVDKDKIYPSDPYYNESFWPPGYSQLTNLGKLQGYNLGVYLRHRYNGFIKDAYDVKDVYVQSSDAPRAIQTAYAVMSGFFLPNHRDNSSDSDESVVNNTAEISLPWKSVPVHTIPAEYDNIIRQKSDNCAKYENLMMTLVEDSEPVRKLAEENRDLMEYFGKHTGYNITHPLQFPLLYDAIEVERYYNMTLPDWVLPVRERAGKFSLFYFQYITYTYEMKRLRVGPFLEKLVRNMNESAAFYSGVSDKTNSITNIANGERKIIFYSGHDTTLTGLLDTLGVYDKKRPSYSAAILLELHQNKSLSDEMYVELYYRSERDDPDKLEIPNCDHPCYLSKFAQLADPYIPTAWEEECRLSTEESGFISQGWIIIIIVAVWAFIFLAFQCWMQGRCFKCCARKPDLELYTQLT